MGMSKKQKFLIASIALIAISFQAAGPLDRYFAGGVVAPELLAKNLTGQIHLITGANTGIGYEAAKQLAKQGAEVVLACRSASRCEGARQKIASEVPNAQVSCMDLDLSSLAAVRVFADQFKQKYSKLDALINNAGVMFPPYEKTVDGFELQWGTNHLGHYLLTELLLDLLKATPSSRIVMVSSRAHQEGTMNKFEDYNWETRVYDRLRPYAASKLANLLYAKSLGHRLAGTGVTAVSLHPGVITTELTRHIPFADKLVEWFGPFVHIFLKTPWEGAATTLHTVLADDLVNGAYYADCAVLHSPNKEAHSDELAAQLDALSAKLVGLETTTTAATATA